MSQILVYTAACRNKLSLWVTVKSSPRQNASSQQIDLDQMEEDDSLESLDRIVRLESLSRSEGARTDGRHDVFDTTENLTSTDSQLHTVQFNESTPVISNYANISRIPKTVMMPTAGIKVTLNSPNISLVDIETFPYRNIFLV